MKSLGLVILLAFTLNSPSQAAKAGDLASLSQSAPSANWSGAKRIAVDIDCDGRPDNVYLSQTEKVATIGVVLGKRGRPSFIQEIGIGDPNQDSVCAAPAELERESLNYHPPVEAVGVVPGFRRSKVCKSFSVSGGECDAFHFFWNHKENKLDWWRL